MSLESIVRQPMSSPLAGSNSCRLASTSTASNQHIYGHRHSRQLLAQMTSCWVWMFDRSPPPGQTSWWSTSEHGKVAAVEVQRSTQTSRRATGNDPLDVVHSDTRKILGRMVMTKQRANITPSGTPASRHLGDSELVARFEREVVPLRESLYRHALRLCRNHFDAEDLTQETMLKAYKGFHSFQPGSNLNAWMFRILSNVHINAYRKKRSQVEQCFSEELTDQRLSTAYARCTPQELRSAEDVALDSLPDNDIKAAMQTLPVQFRTAVYYADVEGLSRTEIAAIMNSQYRTVLSRLHRGRRQLRSLLDVSANHPHGPRPIPAAS